MNMLIWAIQNAGLNRAKIRDLIAYRMEPWQGVTGEIRFSPVLDDVGEVFLARRENGQWKYYTREDLGVPRTAAESAAALTREDDHVPPGSWLCSHSRPPALPGAGPACAAAERRPFRDFRQQARPTPGPAASAPRPLMCPKCCWDTSARAIPIIRMAATSGRPPSWP